MLRLALAPRPRLAVAAGYLSPPTEAARPFAHLLLGLEAHAPADATLMLFVHVLSDGVTWSDWGEVTSNDDQLRLLAQVYRVGHFLRERVDRDFEVERTKRAHEVVVEARDRAWEQPERLAGPITDVNEQVWSTKSKLTSKARRP